MIGGMTHEELHALFGGDIINGFIDAWVAAKLTPEAMTRVVRKICDRTRIYTPEDVAAFLSELLNAAVKG